jgi:hypothetical protein
VYRQGHHRRVSEFCRHFVYRLCCINHLGRTRRVFYARAQPSWPILWHVPQPVLLLICCTNSPGSKESGPWSNR